MYEVPLLASKEIEMEVNLEKHNELMTNYEITVKQIDFFSQNGYLHLPRVFSEKICNDLKEEAEKHSKRRYTNYLDMHENEMFALVHRGARLCGICDQILKARAIPIGSIFFFCKPNNPLEHGSTWHQDNYAAKATFGSYLNAALSLDYADKKNGSLIVIPGSHLLGDLPCNPKPNFSKDENGNLYTSAPIGNDCEVPEGMEQVQLNYGPGDVLLVHAHLIHMANKNVDENRFRRTMYFVYIKDGEPFWPGWTAKRKLLDRYDSEEYN
jgi:hypothetical protein